MQLHQWHEVHDSHVGGMRLLKGSRAHALSRRHRQISLELTALISRSPGEARPRTEAAPTIGGVIPVMVSLRAALRIIVALCMLSWSISAIGSETIHEDFAGNEFNSMLFRALTNQSGGRWDLSGPGLRAILPTGAKGRSRSPPKVLDGQAPGGSPPGPDLF